ncbi:MAG: hypothetical protein PHF00_12525 [Elusimicrobia bacterium]|nr:hypothetical protein [Elusimicrobiota bacterium]
MAAVCLAGWAGIACRKCPATLAGGKREQPAPTAAQNQPPAKTATPESIIADYGRTWVLDGDSYALRGGQQVLTTAAAETLALKIQDYEMCQAAAQLNPDACRSNTSLSRIPGLVTALPDIWPYSGTPLNNSCYLQLSHYLILAELLKGADITEPCSNLVRQSEKELERRDPYPKQACGALMQAYKSGGFASACPVFKELAAHNNYFKNIAAEACGTKPHCPALLPPLKARNESECPSEFGNICRALIDLINGRDPTPQCRKAAEELTRFYQSAPKITSYWRGL